MTTNEIVQAIKQLPAKERMKLINQLGGVANTERDYASYGRAFDVADYDTILDTTDYDAIRKEANEGKEMSSATHVKAEAKDATADKSITPDDVKKVNE